MTPVTHVPTNIITGALGVGKTTLIQALLTQKPPTERWAILVNEFGEVGIDGAIFDGAHASEENAQSIFIKEVPGGCMCCTSGLPMQIALNMLLAQSRPDRLIIEPTGLGHPKEVLQTLSAEHYKDVLNIQATLTLLDVRKLSDKRWRNHQTFTEQVQIADIIVLTKTDLHEQNYARELSEYLHEAKADNTTVVTADKGRIDLPLLAKPSATSLNITDEHHTHHHDAAPHASQVLPTPDNGIVRVSNKGEGFFSRGWICANDRTFNFTSCENLFRKLPVERLKAVIITDKGPYSFNISADNTDIQPLKAAKDSRIEFIVDDEKLADEIAVQIEQILNQEQFE